MPHQQWEQGFLVEWAGRFAEAFQREQSQAALDWAGEKGK